MPPSISESKLKPGIPEEGVVMAIPAISFQLAEGREVTVLVKGEEAKGSEVGRGRGAGRVNSILRSKVGEQARGSNWLLLFISFSDEKESLLSWCSSFITMWLDVIGVKFGIGGIRPNL